MPDIGAIASAVSALNGAKDIAQAMIGLRDSAAFQAKLLEFQSKLIDANSATLAAQDERSSLLEQIRKLEKEVADLKAWDTEKQRYQLTEIGPAAFAYVPCAEANRFIAYAHSAISADRNRFCNSRKAISAALRSLVHNAVVR
jgi:hypothetical protein